MHTFTARAAEGETRVNLILDLEQSIKDHGTAVVKVNLVVLKTRLRLGVLGILSVVGMVDRRASNRGSKGKKGEAESEPSGK
jgi:hypothetical protein